MLSEQFVPNLKSPTMCLCEALARLEGQQHLAHINVRVINYNHVILQYTSNE